MKIQTAYPIIIISMVTLFTACSKADEKVSRSQRLVFLQQTWTSRTTRFYTSDNTQSPYTTGYGPYTTTFTFTTDNIYYNSYTNKPIPYSLLPDDSTLIFTYTNIPQPDQPIYDTNYITSISNSELIFHGYNKSLAMASRDTLRR
jgi:hypothetical protein